MFKKNLPYLFLPLHGMACSIVCFVVDLNLPVLIVAMKLSACQTLIVVSVGDFRVSKDYNIAN